MARTKTRTTKADAQAKRNAANAEKVHRKLGSMTVRELIDALEGYDDDTVVVITSDYGDHCHTEQALGVDEVEQVDLEENAYSDSGYAVADDDFRGPDPEDFDEPAPVSVVALRPRMSRGGW
jgi:hypothetical protein